ncbi:MAG: hypothetical protein ACLSAF_01635 [Intestinimonas sp.]
MWTCGSSHAMRGSRGQLRWMQLRGEWEAEADGVVLIPVDGTLLAAGLREAPSTLAVAVVGPELKGADVGCYISSDPAEMGRQLADAIIADGQSACTVYLPGGAGRPRPSGIRGWSPAFGAEDRLRTSYCGPGGGL